MKWIYFLIAGFVLAGCGNTGTQKDDVPVLEGTYQIIQVGDSRINDPEMTMTFDVEEGRMNGHAGCNGFSASYQLNDSSIEFSRPISTKMYCEGKMEIEDYIFQVLDTISAVRSNNGRVELYSTDQTTLITLRKQENRE